MSGIHPTGIQHIGNWPHAIDQWRQLQDSGDDDDMTVCIADLHSFTHSHASQPLHAPVLLTIALHLVICLHTLLVPSVL